MFNYLTSEIFTRKAQLVWAFLFCATLTTSAFQAHGQFWVFSVSLSLTLISYFLLSNGETIKQTHWWFFAFILLYIYSITLSGFIGRSAYFCLSFVFSYLWYCTLSDLVSIQKLRNDDTTICVLKVTKILLLIFAFIQGCTLIYQYSNTPIRVTGIFLDYSQASLIILLTFGLNYSLLKSINPTISWIIVFFLFLGFFTTFSRSCNFLLLLLLGLIALAEFKGKDTRFIFITIIIIILAYVTVLIYPILLEQQVVDRGGFSDFNTLNSRSIYWQAAIAAIKSNPLFGHGLGNFEFLGIKETLPYNLVNSTHNDYLQVWVDLGVFWFILFISSIFYVVVQHQPFINVSDRSSKKVQLNERYIAWSLALCLSLYMMINFVLYSFIFQIFFSIVIIELTKHEQTETS